MKKIFTITCLTIVLTLAGKAQVTFQLRLHELNCDPQQCIGGAWFVPQGNYHYMWSNGATADSISNLCEGNYWGVVYDSANNVLDSSGFSINPVGLLTWFPTIVQPACTNWSSGSLTAAGFSGVPPYTYMWSNGSTDSTLSGLTSGNYSVTLTDQTGCSGSETYTLNMTTPDYLFYTYATDSVSACNGTNGIATASASGPFGPFSYTWNTTPPQHTATATGLSAGNYIVTVTDAQGCSASGRVQIASPCQNIISGTLFLSTDSTCIPDTSSVLLSWWAVTATDSIGTYYGYTDSLGRFNITVPGLGPYVIKAVNPLTPACDVPILCNDTAPTVTFDSMGMTSGNHNIGFLRIHGFDLALHPGWTSSYPGGEKDYWTFYFNQTASSFQGAAQVFFQYDPALIFLGTDTPYTTYDAATRTLSWTVNHVGTWDRIGNIRFHVPDTLSLGYNLQSRFWIIPTAGDCDSSNNSFVYNETVTGSHDPNSKTVSPAGQLTEADSVLTYTIHFQNTGNDTAWFITVADTLPAGLDPASVVNLASSMPYSSFKISGTGVLTWVFNPAYLPDSAVNPSGSQGFVMFSLKRRGMLAPGTTIANRAAIYFDYNPPVFTNWAADTIALPSAVGKTLTQSNIEVKAYPNPFSDITNIEVFGINAKFDFELYDVTGRLQISMPSGNGNRIQISRGQMAAGVYFYRLKMNSETYAGFGKLVIE